MMPSRDTRLVRAAPLLTFLIFLCIFHITEQADTVMLRMREKSDGDDATNTDKYGNEDEVGVVDYKLHKSDDGDNNNMYNPVIEKVDIVTDVQVNEVQSEAEIHGVESLHETRSVGDKVVNDEEKYQNEQQQHRHHIHRQQQQQQHQQQQQQRTPPTHFKITAHIQTNLHTGYSYFLPKELLSASPAHLPFLECGAVGSTTMKLPLVSGMFRHVPHTSSFPKRDATLAMNVQVENLEHELQKKDEFSSDSLDTLLNTDDVVNNNGNDTEYFEEDNHSHEYKRPSPPKYVVALSSLEITVGGNGNETQKFVAGDVIFIEDLWWGVWDMNGEADREQNETTDATNEDDNKMKGYIMCAPTESNEDLQALMLTIPNAIHRQWKKAQYSATMMIREGRDLTQQQQQQQQHQLLDSSVNTRPMKQSWRRLPVIGNYLARKSNAQQRHRLPPKPCSLESDPAFVHPSVIASVTLSQHFSQYFASLMQRPTNPFGSFVFHHHHLNDEYFLPILLQTISAAVGSITALGIVLQLWRLVPGPVAVMFGSICFLGLGTWGLVWLSEEILDQLEWWRERRRFERLASYQQG